MNRCGWLSIPTLNNSLTNLMRSGKIIVKSDYMYVDIDDQYIHKLFPLIHVDGICKPNYFTAKTNYMGAHISVIYPEENVFIQNDFVGSTLDFEIVGAFTAQIYNRQYFMLTISAPMITQIRESHGLIAKLTFKGYPVDPHITIGVIP